ncbi:hypothetical protein E0Z10_g320 [Xylaria hypoxylon]|uniref:aldehyde dehydrogenase (NAD(+)) n=1 Tax=Xylaria hypoxylon TaxID=37992 RepID=A0A4Z0YVF8_9PEZI|nr:hypothetical protein E0Z10_g320 [Xylaria hypoxylon]
MGSNGKHDSIKLDFAVFRNVVNGKLVDSSSKKTRYSVNPATFEQNPSVPATTLKDVDEAVKSARKASKMASTSFTDAVEAHAEEFAQMLVKEQGKTIYEARGELQVSLQALRGSCVLTLPDEEMAASNNSRTIIKRYIPLGVVVGIVPWNYPMFLACKMLGQGLAAGNAFILKPSPFTPYCNLKLAELGSYFFPPGVLQALSGEDDLGPWLTAHPGIDKVSFAGSIATGKRVMQACSSTLKRVTLELGGNDPLIVCADVDIASVVPTVAYTAFANSGQICSIPKRIYVHESIYQEFLSAMVANIKSLKLTTEEQAAIGPISNKPQYERVKQLLADIEENKLTVSAGSTSPPGDKPGFFLSPTLIDNPPDDSRIVAEEPFGPILPLMKWSDELDVIQRANNTEYGLGASVWSRDAAQAERIARQLEAGTIWINTHAEPDPNVEFGGHKYSGIGVEGGIEGLKGYCNLQIMWKKLC